MAVRVHAADDGFVVDGEWEGCAAANASLKTSGRAGVQRGDGAGVCVRCAEPGAVPDRPRSRIGGGDAGDRVRVDRLAGCAP